MHERRGSTEIFVSDMQVCGALDISALFVEDRCVAHLLDGFMCESEREREGGREREKGRAGGREREREREREGKR